MLFTTNLIDKKNLESALKKVETNKKYRMSTIDTLIYSIDRQAELKNLNELKK